MVVPDPRPNAEAVGPVLQANEIGRLIAWVIEQTNPGARVVDQGSYLRILVSNQCVLNRGTLEDLIGRPFSFPGDLEMLMPSFKGRLKISADQAEWTSHRGKA